MDLLPGWVMTDQFTLLREQAVRNLYLLSIPDKAQFWISSSDGCFQTDKPILLCSHGTKVPSPGLSAPESMTGISLFIYPLVTICMDLERSSLRRQSTKMPRCRERHLGRVNKLPPGGQGAQSRCALPESLVSIRQNCLLNPRFRLYRDPDQGLHTALV